MEFPEKSVWICGKSVCTAVHVICGKEYPQKFIMRL